VGEEAPPESERTVVLVDTSPDLRQQLLTADVGRVDALLFTHDHADQSHGIDDMRAIAYRMRKRIPTYMDEHTKTFVFNRFDYCFEMPDGRVHEIDGPGGQVSVTALGLSHGPTPSLGFIFDNKAVYTPDVWDIAPDVLSLINRPDVWIVDALRYSAHPTHAHVDKSLSWLAATQTQQAVLTNLHIDLDYTTLSAELLPSQSAAFDTMKHYISTV